MLYVKLPEGHPVITADMTPPEQPQLTIEEAIEQAEVVFDDCVAVSENTESGKSMETEVLKVDVTSSNNDLTIISPGTSKRTSPRISPRLAAKVAATEEIIVITDEPDNVDGDAKLAEALSKSHHNLRYFKFFPYYL